MITHHLHLSESKTRAELGSPQENSTWIKFYEAVCLLLNKLILILSSTQDLKGEPDIFPQAGLTFKDIYFHDFRDIYFHDLKNQGRL